MNINKKKIFVLLGLLIAAVIFNFGYKNKSQLIKIEPAQATHGANVFGWAWADLASGNTERGLGWISFNSKNCDSDENGLIDSGAPAGCSSSGGIGQYGVSINQTTGLLSGYGWIGEGSEPVGWITFNTADLTGCPSGICEAKMDISTKQLSGWAKIITINSTSSTDGWIHLSGTAQDSSPYGLNIDNSGNINGWAWGSAILGWVSFSCNNVETNNSTCSTADYQVTTNITQPTNLTTSLDGGQTQSDYCQESLNPTSGADTIIFSWSSSGTNFTLEIDSDGDNIYEAGEYTWTGTATSITVNRNTVISAAISGYSGLTPTTYNWRVRAGTGSWSNSTFILTNHDWPKSAINGQSIVQANTSVTYDSSTPIASESYNGVLSRLWTWPVEFITSNLNTDQSITGFFNVNGSYQITLTAIDNDAHSCTAVKNISTMTIPKWKEISP